MAVEDQIRLILKVAEEISADYGKNCSGECLSATNDLFKELSLKGITCFPQFGTFNGERHAWLDIWIGGNVMLLDVTLSQFGEYPAVLLSYMSRHPEYGWDPDYDTEQKDENR